MKAEYARFNEGKIEYYQFGQGHPIILIPGYAMDVTSWSQTFLNKLAKNHRLIIINNRQVSGTDIKSKRYDSKALASDVNQVIQTLHLKKPDILGISMGGMIAQQVGVQYPNKIGHLILINTAMSGKYGVPPNQNIKNKLINMPDSNLGRYFLAINYFFPASWKIQMAYALANDRFLPQDYQGIQVSKILPLQKGLLEDWVKDNETAYKLKKMNVPTLILNGKADIILPPKNRELLRQNIPQAKLVSWEDGGHAMIYQYPEEMAEVINYFISNRLS